MNDEKVIEAKNEAETGLNGDGRVLLRKSGTEPLIRVMVEAKTDEKCRETAEAIIKVIREKGYVLN